MAYNSHNLKTDASGVKPLSQVYDPALDDMDVLTGASLGSNRYGMDVISWGMTPGGVYVPVQVDANGIQQMSLAGSNAINADVASITTASTAQALPATSCKEVTVTALKGNTGTVYVGGSNVSNSHYGIALDPKDSFTFSVSNVDLLYIYGVAGDGVSYVAV